MSVTLSWKANDDSDNVINYHVERSMVGVETINAEPYNIALNSTLQVRVDGGKLVTVTFDDITDGAATAAEVAQALEIQLNPYGASAYVSSDGEKVILISNRQTDRGSVHIKAGTALSGLGFTPGIRKLQSEAIAIASVAHPAAEYEDIDGRTGFQYRIRAENASSQISEPTDWFSPFKETIPTSVIYGYLIAPNGKPLENIRVEFGPPINKRPSDDTTSGFQPNSAARTGISLQYKEVFTDENGYFQMVVPANVAMRLKIDSVGHDFVYKTPSDGDKQDFTDLTESFSHESFALAGDWWSTTI